MNWLNKCEFDQVLHDEIMEAGSQRSFAKQHRVSEGYISAICIGRKKVSEKLARSMGYRRMVVFTKIGE